MDYVANLISAVRLGYQKRMRHIYIKTNVFASKILACLITLNYLSGFSLIDKDIIKITLKYDSAGNPVMKNIILISRRGKRIYWSYRQLKIYGAHFLDNKMSFGILLFTTCFGLLWHQEVYNRSIGGEVLLFVN